MAVLKLGAGRGDAFRRVAGRPARPLERAAREDPFPRRDEARAEDRARAARNLRWGGFYSYGYIL